MAESCQAYKCTHGSRLEYLFSFNIFFPINQVTSLLATKPWRRNSRKKLHFWWELIRRTFTWNSSRLLRVFLSRDDGTITYWGAPTVLTSARERGRDLRAQRSLVLCRVEQKRLLKTNSKETESQSLHKDLSLFWQIIRAGLWFCPEVHLPHIWDRPRITIQVLEHISERITVSAVIIAFDGEYSSDIFAECSLFFFLLYLFLFPFITMAVHTLATDTQLALIKQESMGEAGGIVFQDDEI